MFIDRLETYLGRNTTLEERQELLLEFEDLIANYLTPLWKREDGTVLSRGGNYSEYQLFFTVYKSLNDLAVSAGDIQVELIVLWYAVVFVYAYLAYLNHRNAVYSHSIVVVASIAAVSLATLAAIGLSAWLGFPATSLTNTVVPFIAMGIGIDDTFVIVSTYMQVFDRSLDAETIAAKTTAIAGPMILYTTATNMVAYGIASVLPIYIVQLFCWQMILNIALNLVVLMLMVIPFLRYDALRILRGNREASCFPGDVEAESDKREHWLNAFLESLYTDYLFTPKGKAISAVFFAILFGLLAWQAFTYDNRGLDMSAISPDGSFQRDFFKLDEQHFGFRPAYFVLQSGRFESREMQEFVFDSFDTLLTSPWVNAYPRIELQQPLQLMRQDLNLSGPVDPNMFYRVLADFMRLSGEISLDRMVCKDVISDEFVSCLKMTGTETGLAYNPNIRLWGLLIPFPLKGLVSTEDIITSVDETQQLMDRVASEYDASEDPNFRCYVSVASVLSHAANPVMLQLMGSSYALYHQ